GAKFDLTLTLHESEGGLSGAAEYATDLFDEATIVRLLAALRRVLEAIAVEAGGEALTYRELERRANRLAHRLVRLGIGPGERVALLAERTSEMLVGMLAVLKAGGAYVPVDPAYPEERIALLLDDSMPRVLLAPRELLGELPPCSAALVALDDRLEGESDARPATRARPEDLAYLIYTSGSTGRPKGVMVTHANAVHSTSARLVHYTERPRRFALLPSFAFDSSVAGIFWTLAAGGTLLLPPAG